jgi:hypothetical protein
MRTDAGKLVSEQALPDNCWSLSMAAGALDGCGIDPAIGVGNCPQSTWQPPTYLPHGGGHADVAEAVATRQPQLSQHVWCPQEGLEAGGALVA